jgi:hypothetical protein
MNGLIEYGISEHTGLALPILYVNGVNMFPNEQIEVILPEIVKKIILTEKVKNIIFMEKCCICLDDSDCMTECGHELCVICVKKVKKCPMCREELKCYYVNK